MEGGGGFASWVEAASLSDPHKTQVLGEWAMGLIHKMLVKFSNPFHIQKL